MGCSSKRIIFFVFISFWIIFLSYLKPKKNKVFRQTHFTLSSHAYHFQIFFLFLLDNIFQVIKCKKCLGHFSQRKMFFIILIHITHHFSTHIWLLQSIHKRFSWGYYYIMSIINFISLFSYFYLVLFSLELWFVFKCQTYSPKNKWFIFGNKMWAWMTRTTTVNDDDTTVKWENKVLDINTKKKVKKRFCSTSFWWIWAIIRF